MGITKFGILKLDLKTAVRYSHDRVLNKHCMNYIINSKSILNVGSGYRGTYSELFLQKDYETLDILQEAKPTYVMNILQEIPNKEYDLVIAFNVMEHIQEPKIFLKNIKKLLKEDGIFIMSIPFIYSIHSKGDYYRYAEDGLKYLVGKYFKNFKIIPFGNPFLSFLRGIAPIKYIGIPFNLTSKFWEYIFRYTDFKSPSGYFVLCSKSKAIMC